jgi:hypothetical protein
MLTQQLPRVTTNMMYPVGASRLRLAVIEPHYNGKHLDNHIFACSKCDEIQTYVFDRTFWRFARAPVAKCVTLVEQCSGIS